MAVTFRSKNQTIGSGTSPTVGEPASAASGDALIALAICDNTGNPVKPTGWTDLYSGTSGAADFLVSWIARGGSAPSLTWTLTGSVYREVHILCLTGAVTLTLDSQSASGSTGSNNLDTVDPDPPATVAVATTSLAVAGAFHYSGSNAAWVAPSGYTIRTQNSGGAVEDAVMCTKSLSASGSEDPAAILGTGLTANGYWNGFTVTFTDAGGGASIVPILMAQYRQRRRQALPIHPTRSPLLATLRRAA